MIHTRCQFAGAYYRNEGKYTSSVLTLHNFLLVPEQKAGHKDNKGSTKMSCTENGRGKMMSNSKYLEDKILWGLSEREKEGIQYLLKTCYTTYNKSRAWEEIRQRKLDEVHQPEKISSTAQSPKPPCSRPKRQKTVASMPPRE